MKRHVLTTLATLCFAGPAQATYECPRGFDRVRQGDRVSCVKQSKRELVCPPMHGDYHTVRGRDYCTNLAGGRRSAVAAPLRDPLAEVKIEVDDRGRADRSRLRQFAQPVRRGGPALPSLARRYRCQPGFRLVTRSSRRFECVRTRSAELVCPPFHGDYHTVRGRDYCTNLAGGRKSAVCAPLAGGGERRVLTDARGRADRCELQQKGGLRKG